MVVDDYTADEMRDRQWRQSAEGILVLDDHASRVGKVDVRLVQALIWTANDYVGLVPSGCRVLSGPNYPLGKPEFGSLARALAHRSTGDGIRSVFVSMDGTDAGSSLRRVITAIAVPLVEERPVVHVMVSTLSRAAVWLDDLANELPYECICSPRPS